MNKPFFFLFATLLIFLVLFSDFLYCYCASEGTANIFPPPSGGGGGDSTSLLIVTVHSWRNGFLSNMTVNVTNTLSNETFTQVTNATGSANFSLCTGHYRITDGVVSAEADHMVPKITQVLLEHSIWLDFWSPVLGIPFIILMGLIIGLPAALVMILWWLTGYEDSTKKVKK